MKMNRLVAFSAGLMMLVPVLSNAKGVAVGEEGSDVALTFVEQVTSHPRGISNCEGVTLDEAQMMALHTAKFAYMKQKNTLDAVTKNAWMDYMHTLGDMASTRDQGVAAATAMSDAVTAGGAAKSEFEIKVFFDILKPEQRMPAMKCVMAAMKQKMQDDLKKKCAMLPPKGKPTP